MIFGRSNTYLKRYYVLVALLVIIGMCLIYRMITLSVFRQNFLRIQGDARSLRIVQVPAYRGIITDRMGAPLAVSTPVKSLWVNPKVFDLTNKHIATFTKKLNISLPYLKKLVLANLHKEFLYIRRGMAPNKAKALTKLKIPGVGQLTEYKRYYPEGALMAHVVGLTNIDDKGQEGLELAYDSWLQGVVGKRRVVKDRLGHIVDEINSIKPAKSGKHLILSIDRRIQYMVYQALKKVALAHTISSGSVVVLDSQTSEVLAMANFPSYNPNRRPGYEDGRYRNRALTDVYELGSVIKPFAIASALDSGKYGSDSIINTSPGHIRVGGHDIKDTRDHGDLTITRILQRSSNVGIAKITLSLPPEQLYDVLTRVGFGQRTGSGYPGERSGYVSKPKRAQPLDLATLGFGYGITASALQLARAYGVFATGGKLTPITFLKRDNSKYATQVLSKSVANQMLASLETVVEAKGTGRAAKITGYRVAGKTGTARIASHKGYDKTRHVASFAGIAPVSAPRLVVVVLLVEPKTGGYYGGKIAAPLFAEVMAGALKIMNVMPDKIVAKETKKTS